MIKKYFDFIKENNEISEIKAGKHIFNSFLKVLTSLGVKDTKPKWNDIPDDYLLFFEYKSDYLSVYDKFERFNSLYDFKEKIPKINCILYYGIKNNMEFRFGFINNKTIEIGVFKINNSVINYLLLLNSKSALHLKKELAYLNIDNLKLICKISKYIKIFHPGNTKNRTFKINDGILEFGYEGLGIWNEGILSNVEEIKKIFKEYLLSFKEHNKILFSIKTDNGNCIILSIKIK